MAHIEGIYIVRETGGNPEAVERVDVDERGLAGDRYAAGIGTFCQGLTDGRAVSLIEAEHLELAEQEFGDRFPEGSHRRNVLVRGIDLQSLLRQKFRLGTAVLRGVRPAPPCGYLERLTGTKARKSLKYRGGLRAEVLVPGTIAVGDELVMLEDQQAVPA